MLTIDRPMTNGERVAGKRVSIQVEIDADAAAKLRTILAGEDRIQKRVLSRMVEWFALQPAWVRSVVTGVDEGMEESYAAMLEKLATEVRGRRTGKRPRVGLINPPNPEEGSGGARKTGS